jgi:hypothetical protein
MAINDSAQLLVPDDFQSSLALNATKTTDARMRRIDKAVLMLAEGRAKKDMQIHESGRRL